MIIFARSSSLWRFFEDLNTPFPVMGLQFLSIVEPSALRSIGIALKSSLKRVSLTFSR